MNTFLMLHWESFFHLDVFLLFIQIQELKCGFSISPSSQPIYNQQLPSLNTFSEHCSIQLEPYFYLEELNFYNLVYPWLLNDLMSYILKFIYFWLSWVFVAARGLSLLAVSGSYSSLRCVGFSLRWLLLWRSMGSRHGGFRSCGSRSQLLRSMWDLPRPGLEPLPPALAGGFLTTAPPGKPSCHIFDLATFCCVFSLFYAYLQS